MASTYLTRSLASTNTSWTFSAWVKRSALGDGTVSTINYLISWGTSGTDATGISFNRDNNFEYYSESSPDNKQKKTSAVYRDTSAWYHVVVKSDSNAITLYVNGEEPTQAWTVGSSGNPLDTSTMTIGKWVTSAYYLNGSMAHVHFIDGTAYDASAFGETDATTGIWKPKTAPSVTYGTNGFFLKFENSGAFGTDSSGNSNTFTVNGTMTQTIDTPSNVFCLFNPLVSVPNSTYSNGNTKVNNNDTHKTYYGNLAVTKGKYYWEGKATTGTATKHGFGLSDVRNLSAYQQVANTNLIMGTDANSYLEGDAVGWYSTNVKKNGSSVTGFTGLSAIANNDIISMALDLDNGYCYIARNGTYLNSGDPTSGATGTGGISISTGDDRAYVSAVSAEDCNWLMNWGNGYFGTTAVSSAQNPDDGIGIFEYDVPAGYRALCTKSINAEEYS